MPALCARLNPTTDPFSLPTFVISFNVFAGDEEKVKQGLVERFTSGLSDAVENILDGEGDTRFALIWERITSLSFLLLL